MIGQRSFEYQRMLDKHPSGYLRRAQKSQSPLPLPAMRLSWKSGTMVPFDNALVLFPCSRMTYAIKM